MRELAYREEDSDSGMNKWERAEVRRIANCPFGIHEALHTAHVMLDSFSDHVRDHPAVSERPEIAALADAAIETMMEVYQALGRISDGA